MANFVNPGLIKRPATKKKSRWQQAKDLFWKTIKNPRLLALVFGIGLTLALLITAITYAVFANSLATPESIINRKNSGLIFYDRHGEEFYRTAGARDTTIITLDRIPDELEQATIAIEDKNFYEHDGFSLQGYMRAIVTNIKLADPTAVGGSTITQQLVKNALLSQKKSFLRKFQELVLSIEIDRRFSKDQILELYLTSTYYGAGAYGVEEAAKIYFDKDLMDLTLAESTMLAGLPQAPSAYSPLDGDRELAGQRQRQVIRAMEAEGYITAEQAEQTAETELNYNTSGSQLRSNKAPHFVEYVTKLLANEYGEDTIVRAGYKVYTTLDINLQDTAQQTVTNRVAALSGAGANNGALVAIEPSTGQMLAMVGSADYNNDDIDGKFNVATSPNRQPGSATKPFAYLRSFEEGYTPASILHDKPTDFGGGYEPQNADRRFRGDVTVRRALANSLNIPAVEMLRNIGANDFINTMRDFGVKNMSDDAAQQCGLAIVLGCAEMPLLDLTHAYATLADEGTYRDLVTYTKIEDKSGNQVYPSKSFGFIQNSENPGRRVVDRGIAYLITDILGDNTARSEAFGSNSPLRLSRPASVKTGTTDDSKDAWAVGYTPQITIGVWVGNTASTPMSLAGATGAAPIWNAVMESYLSGKPVQEFEQPSNVVQLMVCRGQEAIAEEKGTNTFAEIFVRAHIPENTCAAATPTPTPTPQKDDEEDEENEDDNGEDGNGRGNNGRGGNDDDDNPGGGNNPPGDTPTPTQTPTPTPTPTPTLTIPDSVFDI